MLFSYFILLLVTTLLCATPSLSMKNLQPIALARKHLQKTNFADEAKIPARLNKTSPHNFKIDPKVGNLLRMMENAQKAVSNQRRLLISNKRIEKDISFKDVLSPQWKRVSEISKIQKVPEKSHETSAEKSPEQSIIVQSNVLTLRRKLL